jgi:hypothetical protein
MYIVTLLTFKHSLTTSAPMHVKPGVMLQTCTTTFGSVEEVKHVNTYNNLGPIAEKGAGSPDNMFATVLAIGSCGTP